MRIFLKEGVSLKGLGSEALAAMLIVYTVYDDHGVPLTITSVNDSKHMEGSLHYKGFAFDCRLPSRYVEAIQIDQRIANDIRGSLNADFDVILEIDHIHVEYDPKERVA